MDIFASLADPTRRAMLDMLAGGEHSAGDFVAAFPLLSQPAVSQHLKALRQAELVAVRAEGQRRIYALRAERLQQAHAWLERYRPFWASKLDALARHLDQNPQMPGRHGDDHD